jgi:hypothetical protein
MLELPQKSPCRNTAKRKIYHPVLWIIRENNPEFPTFSPWWTKSVPVPVHHGRIRGNGDWNGAGFEALRRRNIFGVICPKGIT